MTARKKSGIPLIAELAQVSIGTVDRALHGRPGINERTRQKVLDVARRIGYQPNLAARSLSTGKRVRIGICVPREIAYFYNHLWAGIHDEVNRYRQSGMEFVEVPVPELGRGDREALKKLVRAEVQGIVLTPGDPERLRATIDEAEEAGIRVICVSTDAPESRRSSIVCVEPQLNGLMAGELMAGFVPPGSKVAVITGMLKTVDHRAKAAGFQQSFSKLNRNGTVVATIEAYEDAARSFRRTKQLLGDVPDVAGIYVNTVNCLPVCRALTASDRAGKVRLITTDLFGEMVPYFESGTISASMHQRPYRQGQLAVRSLAEHLLHGAEIPPSQYLNPSIVLRNNLHLFRETNLTLAPLPKRKSRRA
jgi:LacI family transcriptional regulator